jgi:FkbM family methyltransferase
VYVFEAHPDIYAAIKKIHNFNAYNYAVFDEEGEMKFHVVPLDFKNTGVSSLHESIITAGKKVETKEVLVKSIRMDNFMNQNHIDKVDFLKLDAEGVDFEVLNGFGERLRDVNSIHLEAEHVEEAFGGKAKFFDDISTLLTQNGFVLIYFQRYITQSDSFWIRKEYIKSLNQYASDQNTK